MSRRADRASSVGKSAGSREMRTARRRAPAHWKWERDILLQGASVRASRYSVRNFSFILGALTALLATMAPSMTETAAANGDTRTINLFYVHTGESISATYLVNGQYNPAALQQLNWFLRDWRHNEPIEMDPRLFDVVWEAYRSAGAEGEVVTVVSAYRSPQTNAMLRARSRSVAKFSQHMLGKAMDTTMPGMPMSRIREVGMRMQRGGVGYYPTAGTPFVHLDVGNVRAWPRMSYDQLVRLFPDGKTVHLPSNGQPLARYEEAKAEIEARNNGAIVVAPRKSSGGFFAFLFGGGEDEGEDVAPAPAPSTRKQWAQLAPRNSRAAKIAAAESDEEGGGESPAETRRSAEIAKAQANLPRGETVMTAAPDDKPLQPPPRDKAAVVNAPLPPGRPASLDKPVPIEPPPAADKRFALASAEPEDSGKFLRGNLAEQARELESAADAPTLSNAPMPPRRPRDLVASLDPPLPPTRPMELNFAAGEDASPVAAAADVPLPPSRPKSLGAAERGRADNALASLIDVTGSVDGQPGTTPARPVGMRGTDTEMLAYAPPAPVRDETAAGKPAAKAAAPRTSFVPARLDHSNFEAMTQTTPASKTSMGSVLGASIGAVRSAARAAEPSMLTSPNGGAATRFSNQISAPAADKFAGR
jgi:uncharacterized protein YcbK (DUF882 family)